VTFCAEDFMARAVTSDVAIFAVRLPVAAGAGTPSVLGRRLAEYDLQVVFGISGAVGRMH